MHHFINLTMCSKVVCQEGCVNIFICHHARDKEYFEVGRAQTTQTIQHVYIAESTIEN